MPEPGRYAPPPMPPPYPGPSPDPCPEPAPVPGPAPAPPVVGAVLATADHARQRHLSRRIGLNGIVSSQRRRLLRLLGRRIRLLLGPEPKSDPSSARPRPSAAARASCRRRHRRRRRGPDRQERQTMSMIECVGMISGGSGCGAKPNGQQDDDEQTPCARRPTLPPRPSTCALSKPKRSSTGRSSSRSGAIRDSLGRFVPVDLPSG